MGLTTEKENQHAKKLRTSVFLAMVTLVTVGTTAQPVLGMLEDDELDSLRTWASQPCRLCYNEYGVGSTITPTVASTCGHEHWELTHAPGHSPWYSISTDGIYLVCKDCDLAMDKLEKHNAAVKAYEEEAASQEAALAKQSADEEAELRKELLRLQIKALKEGQPSSNIAVAAVNLNIGNSSFSSSSSSSSKK